MTYLVIGGSSGLGKALAEKYAAEGYELVLISQDYRDISALSAHLSLKCDVRVSAVEMDLSLESLPYGKIEAVLQEHRPIKGVFAPVGFNDEDDLVGLSSAKMEKITRVNYLSTCKLINHFLPAIRENQGAVVGFGSVATARGRSQNAAYAAAKRALESYFESLRHALAQDDCSVSFYSLGYLDTNLAFAENLLFPKASPDKLAKHVYSTMADGGASFFPGYWKLIVKMVQWIPWRIYKRMSF
jgi:decaprenylphospho-beta-D-erythro-pentofuranosid-2-ulose 2-reductase